MKNVLLTGGIYHPFAETSAALVSLFEAHGVQSVVTEDVAEAVAELQYADIFTINALRWRMENDEKYAPHRARWAFELPEWAAQQIENFVESGGGLLGMHTASICFDTWYGYRNLLGGTWSWGRTFHPELGPVEARVVSDHPVGQGVPPFRLTDEVYHNLDVAADVDILLDARVPGGDWQTVAWCREWGEGRVVYDALGHGPDSLACVAHRQLLQRSIAWLMGEL